MLMGASRNALRAFNARVSLTCLYVLARKLPRLLYGPVFVAHLFSRGPVLRTCNSVMAHRPIGSAQTECIRLPYTAPEASHRAFFFKVQPPAHGNGNQGKGKLFPLSGPVRSVHADDRMDELDFQSALHVLVHPYTGLAVRIVKRPGTELVDIALIVPQYIVHGLGIPITGGVDHRKRKKLFSFVVRLLYSR